MAITEKQRRARNAGVGASEVASVLGLDPWRSAYDLWLLKTEKHEETGRAEESEAAEIGNEIEATSARLAERRMGCRLVKPTGTYKANNGIMFANLDRQVEKAARGAANVELKSTGLIEGWGDAGSDEVPERVLLQVHAQMICSESRISHVARLLGRFGFSFSLFEVPYNPTLAEIIEEQVCDFWRNHVVRDVPPENSLPSLAAVARVRREAGKSVDLAEQLPLIIAFDAARAAHKLADEAKERAQAALLAALGDAEAATAPGWSVAFRAITSQRLDAAAFKAAHPELAAQFMSTSTHRRLEVRAAKPEKGKP